VNKKSTEEYRDEKRLIQYEARNEDDNPRELRHKKQK
jgi:hypothetical protein